MNWLTQLFARRRAYDEVEHEIQTHLQEKIDEMVEGGMPMAEATAAARRQFGNVASTEERSREVWRWTWLEDLGMDIRHGLRVLRQNPGFSFAAVTVLALGIGANTALFSVVNGVLLRPLPYPHPEQLVTLRESKPNFATGSISYPNFLDWQKNNRTFESMAVLRTGRSAALTGRGQAEQVNLTFVSAGFFEQLGVNPVLGRTFEADEDRHGGAPAVMVTAGFWKRKLGATPDVLGTSLILDGVEHTIVGVVPENFDLLGTLRTNEIYAPIAQWANPYLSDRGAGLGVGGIGRLKAGVSIEQARADMERVTRDLAQAYPDTDQGIGATLIPFRQRMLGSVQPVLGVLFGAVGFVLLIACVNVANLLLARSNARAHEFAIRAALGAGQKRIIRQLLTESILIAAIGGGSGVVLAALGTHAALRLLPVTLPRASEVGVDGRALIFAAAISLLAGICFGLAPALRTARHDLQEFVKEGGRGKTGARHGAQSALVAAEIALTLVLLVGAGLMLRTLGALWNVNPGFDASKVLTLGLSLPPAMAHAKPDAIRARFREVQTAFQSAPGVEAVSITSGAIPLSADDEWLFWIDGQPTPATRNEMKWALNYVVGADYLKVMGIPLQRGRFFNSQDDERGARVVVIDDVLAGKYFPGEDPLGKRLHLADYPNGTAEIVGVVGHVNQWGLDSDGQEELRAQLYVPFPQLSDETMAQSSTGVGVLVRTENAASAMESIRRANGRMSSEQVVFDAQTMNEIIADSLAERRFTMILFGVFAALALLLSSLGIYGVVSYLTAQRTQEIGVRVALGAQRADVLRMILGKGIKMTALGVLIGLVAALGLTRLMSKLLFGVSPSDPVTFIAVALLLALVALAACYFPARRAARLDPMAALRYE